MLGLAVFTVAVAYIAFWRYVFKRVTTRPRKIGTALIAVALPFWNLPIGYLTFLQRCRTDGGLHVTEKIAPQKNVCIEATFTHDPSLLLKAGFEIVEYRNRKGTTQYRRVADGSIEKVSIERPQLSTYCLSATYGRRLSWDTSQQDFLVSTTSSGTPVARFTSFTWHGGFWWLPDGLPRGAVASCFNLKADEILPVLLKGGG